MFRGGFNQTEFNTSVDDDIVHLYGTLSASAGLSVISHGSFTLSSTLSGEASSTAAVHRQIVALCLLAAEGDLAAKFFRNMPLASKLSGNSSLEASPTKTHYVTVEVSEDFKPGDVFLIDSRRRMVLKNGQPIGYVGDIFEIHPGGNRITYKDSETVRSVVGQVTYRDGFL